MLREKFICLMTTKAKVVHKISNKIKFYHYEEWLTFQFAKESNMLSKHACV